MTDIWLAEGFGALALVCNFIAYRQNRVNHYRFISALGLTFLSTHFFLLSAMAAGIGCGLAAIRNLIALRYRPLWLVYFFVLLHLPFFIYEWWWLNHGWPIILAYVSAIIFTLGSLLLQHTHRIRQWFILAEGLGLAYALLVGSLFGSLFNISNLSSIGIKLYQDRRPKRARQSDAD
ncbi:YgjV family protein [Bowmanella dokdonensis]|uniref:YgjV family protein n=1 Tax=Bowmanella dokdonensis TaxID=751969 RepID=A0A939DMM7_9ALTE|nr:YgjV family protein [Bowmanella dokdonensis]MBN7825574.1 YgjV family protein [Bowmanella dokdonensis]